MKRKKAQDIEPAGMLYFVTNQYNLREILSSGFIGSIYSFDDKYYEDLLKECPGSIPLFQQPLDTEIIDAVNKHDRDTSYALLLEIDRTALIKDKIVALDSNSDDAEINKIAVIVYQDTIPIKAVMSIIFLEDRTLIEFSSRSLSDLPDYSKLFRVSSQYVREGHRSETILNKLRHIKKIDFPTTKDFIKIDKVGGAIDLCYYYLSQRNSNTEDLLYVVKKVSPKMANNIPSWMFMGLEPKLNAELAEIVDINVLLFCAAATILHRYNNETVNQKSIILKEIEELTIQVLMSEEDGLTLKRAYARTKKYINSEIDFEPFKTQEGYEVSKALLLFLLRPKYTDLLSWSNNETGASDEIMLTALAFAGIIVGRKSIDVRFRNIEFEQTITENLLDTIKKKKDPKFKITKGDKQKELLKKASREETELPVLDELKDFTASDSDKIDKKIWELSNSELSGELMEIAIWLCKKMKWNNCQVSKIEINELNEFSFLPYNKGQMSELRIRGPINIRTEIDLQEFRLKILDPILHKEIVDTLKNGSNGI